MPVHEKRSGRASLVALATALDIVPLLGESLVAQELGVHLKQSEDTQKTDRRENLRQTTRSASKAKKDEMEVKQWTSGQTNERGDVRP